MVNKLIDCKSSKKYKIKRIFFFLVNTKYISSRELKTSKFSFVLRTHENSDVFTTLDEIYLVFTSKKVNIPYISHQAFSSYGSLFMKIHRFNDVRSLTQIFFIRIL